MHSNPVDYVAFAGFLIAVVALSVRADGQQRRAAFLDWPVGKLLPVALNLAAVLYVVFLSELHRRFGIYAAALLAIVLFMFYLPNDGGRPNASGSTGRNLSDVSLWAWLLTTYVALHSALAFLTAS